MLKKNLIALFVLGLFFALVPLINAQEKPTEMKESKMMVQDNDMHKCMDKIAADSTMRMQMMNLMMTKCKDDKEGMMQMCKTMMDKPEMHKMMKNMMRGGMMQGGMMQGGMGMMNQNMPMQKYMMMIQKLPMMTQALSLTESQAKQLLAMRTDFMKKKIDYQAAIDKKKIDLENMLENDASSSELKTAMESIADSKIDMNISAYETSKKMKGALTDQQKQTLKNIWMNQGMMGGGMMNNSQMQQGGVMNDDDQN